MTYRFIFHIIFIVIALTIWVYLAFFSFVANKTVRNTAIRPPRFIRNALHLIPFLCGVSVAVNLILIVKYLLLGP